MKCAYCKDLKCNCGGRRAIISSPRGKKDGEVKIQCKKCGCTWLHFHRGNLGTARPM